MCVCVCVCVCVCACLFVSEFQSSRDSCGSLNISVIRIDFLRWVEVRSALLLSGTVALHMVDGLVYLFAQRTFCH